MQHRRLRRRHAWVFYYVNRRENNKQTVAARPSQSVLGAAYASVGRIPRQHVPVHAQAGGDTTCQGWTSNGQGSAIVGHHDRAGLSMDWHMLSWNSAHGSAGCGQADLRKTGGDGLFYCFHAQ